MEFINLVLKYNLRYWICFQENILELMLLIVNLSNDQVYVCSFDISFLVWRRLTQVETYMNLENL